ncbi:MAG: hypothetical protein GY715_17765 [Planctomycetes bacterium]|nr:hypothetical protein [Planctomycetota bacterium]
MIRGFLAVIVGLVLIVLCLLFGLLVARIALGGFFAPEEGSEVVPLAGTLIAQGLGLVSAVIGGFVAALIAGPARRAVPVLAVLVLVLGLVHAVTEPARSERLAADEMARVEAGDEPVVLPRAPTWHNWVVPVVGCVGVLIGGSLCGRPEAGGSGGDS